MSKNDKEILRPLAEQYLEVCSAPEQEERRELWRRLNALDPIRPAVYARRFAWQEMPQCISECEDPLLAGIEKGTLRRRLFWATLGDDAIFEPWIVMPESTSPSRLCGPGLWSPTSS